MDTNRVPQPRPASLDATVETHYSGLERPHACIDGWVMIGQLVVDPETGVESEEHALYLCRKCAERR